MTDSIYEKLSNRRKKLQEQDLIPSWFTTAGLQMFESKYEYQTNGRSVRGQFERIAATAAKHLKGTKYESQAYDKFFELMWNKWMTLSTPVFCNMGTDRGLPVSCSGNYVEDSIDGFYSSMREIAILTKHGFGTASYLGDIRPRGTPITGGGKASGILPVLKNHVQVARDVSQGNSRRGAWAGYVPIDHGDFDEVANFAASEPDDVNIGWNISDDFVAKLNAGDSEALRRYQKSLVTKLTAGRGYYAFIDKINRNRPQMYKDHGLTIKSMQLCLTGDTVIDIRFNGVESSESLEEFVTKFQMGYYPIVEVKSYDGDNVVWSKVSTAAQTAVVTELYEIETPTGNVIRCTGNHQIYTKNRGYVEAQHLEETDELMY